MTYFSLLHFVQTELLQNRHPLRLKRPFPLPLEHTRLRHINLLLFQRRNLPHQQKQLLIFHKIVGALHLQRRGVKRRRLFGVLLCVGKRREKGELFHGLIGGHRVLGLEDLCGLDLGLGVIDIAVRAEVWVVFEGVGGEDLYGLAHHRSGGLLVEGRGREGPCLEIGDPELD